MRDVRPSVLFWFGITASFAFNIAITAILFSREAIVAGVFWQATLLLSLVAFLFGTLPVFGGMAIVTWRVQRQSTRELASKSLVKCLLVCFAIACFGAIWASRSYLPGTVVSALHYYFSLETTFVGLVLCIAISLNLLLRYFGFQRDQPTPTVTSETSES